MIESPEGRFMYGPRQFALFFRDEPQGRVYDPRAGRGEGRRVTAIQEADARLRYGALHARLDKAMPWLKVGSIIGGAIVLTLGIRILGIEASAFWVLLVAFPLFVAAPMLMAEFLLRRFRWRFWDSLQFGAAIPALSREEQVRRGFRMGRKQALLWTALFVFVALPGLALQHLAPQALERMAVDLMGPAGHDVLTLAICAVGAVLFGLAAILERRKRRASPPSAARRRSPE
jgi:MFS family permease